MEQRCDQIIHCRDNSDEKNCYLLVFKEVESYNKKVPPFTISTEDKSLVPVKVQVSTSLMNVLAISEFSHTIDLKLGITLEWYENRVLYHNLKTKKALNVLSDSEVSFKKIPLSSSCPLCTKMFKSVFTGEQPLDPLHHISEYGHR